MLGLLYTARCASCLLTFEGQVVELRLAEARRHVSAARELAQRGVADAAVQVRVQLDLRLGCGRVGEYGVIKHPAAARRLGSGRCHSGLGAWGRPAAGSVPLPACRWQRAAGSVLLAAPPWAGAGKSRAAGRWARAAPQRGSFALRRLRPPPPLRWPLTLLQRDRGWAPRPPATWRGSLLAPWSERRGQIVFCDLATVAAPREARLEVIQARSDCQ